MSLGPIDEVPGVRAAFERASELYDERSLEPRLYCEKVEAVTSGGTQWHPCRWSPAISRPL